MFSLSFGISLKLFSILAPQAHPYYTQLGAPGFGWRYPPPRITSLKRDQPKPPKSPGKNQGQILKTPKLCLSYRACGCLGGFRKLCCDPWSHVFLQQLSAMFLPLSHHVNMLHQATCRPRGTQNAFPTCRNPPFSRLKIGSSGLPSKYRSFDHRKTHQRGANPTRPIPSRRIFRDVSSQAALTKLKQQIWAFGTFMAQWRRAKTHGKSQCLDSRLWFPKESQLSGI